MTTKYGHFATKPLTKRLRKTYLIYKSYTYKIEKKTKKKISSNSIDFRGQFHPTIFSCKYYYYIRYKRLIHCQCLSYLDCCSFHGKINKEQTVFPSSLTIHSFIGKKGYTQWLKINFSLIL